MQQGMFLRHASFVFFSRRAEAAMTHILLTESNETARSAPRIMASRRRREARRQTDSGSVYRSLQPCEGTLHTDSIFLAGQRQVTRSMNIQQLCAECDCTDIGVKLAQLPSGWRNGPDRCGQSATRVIQQVSATSNVTSLHKQQLQPSRVSSNWPCPLAHFKPQ